MELSIIILNYKTKGLTKYCIKGIQKMRLPFDYEIIVVDNNSKDGTSEMIQEEFVPNGNVRLITCDQNRGYAAGNNLGIKAAQSKYILILNPDIAVIEGSIETLHGFMENNPGVAIAGPQLLNPDKTTQLSCCRWPSLLTPLYRRTPLGKLPFGKRSVYNYLMKDWDHQSNRFVDWMLGACIMIRKEAIEKVGLMDERYFLYFEDVDWCRRFWQAGYKVHYVADAKMIHYHQRESAQGSFIEVLRKPTTRAHIASGIKYFWKYRKQNQPYQQKKLLI